MTGDEQATTAYPYADCGQTMRRARTGDDTMVINQSVPCRVDGEEIATPDLSDLMMWSDDGFREYVMDHVHDYMGEGGPGGGVWATLSHPRIVARTRAVLVQAQEQLDSTITRRTNEIRTHRQTCFHGGEGLHALRNAEIEFNDWRVKAVHLRQLIQGKLRSTRAAAREARQTAHELVGSYRELVRQLSFAIAVHRRATTYGEVVPESSDRELWRVLDLLAMPDQQTGSGSVSLAYMIEHCWFGPGTDAPHERDTDERSGHDVH